MLGGVISLVLAGALAESQSGWVYSRQRRASARLFPGDVVPREIARRKCDREKDDQDDNLHNELRLYPR